MTVLRDCLRTASATLDSEWEIVALVHDRCLVEEPRVRVIAVPDAKGSWFRRLSYEWWGFDRLLDGVQIDLWLSLHDITPRVKARRQAVYCHNPAPFYRITWREAKLEPRFLLFNAFYLQLYRAFIRRNHTVVVQQAWLREAFTRLFAHPNVVVAYPSENSDANSDGADIGRSCIPTALKPLVLLYPSLPRVFKNMDVLCQAMSLLPPELKGLVELRLTLSGTENAYSRDLWRRYASVPGVMFIGRQSRAEMDNQYEHCDVVLFPSKLETWGLPITEAKARRRPLLVADLPYAHETVGTWDAVSFLSPHDPRAWAAAIAKIATGDWHYEGQTGSQPHSPFAANWPELWRLLTDGL